MYLYIFLKINAWTLMPKLRLAAKTIEYFPPGRNGKVVVVLHPAQLIQRASFSPTRQGMSKP